MQKRYQLTYQRQMIVVSMNDSRKGSRYKGGNMPLMEYDMHSIDGRKELDDQTMETSCVYVQIIAACGCALLNKPFRPATV